MDLFDIFFAISLCMVAFFQCCPDCGSCTCTRCATVDGVAIAPCCLQVVISGFANIASPPNDCWCERCDKINGTFDCPQLAVGGCEWRGTICSAGQAHAACRIARVNATLVLTGADYILDVELRDTNGEGTPYFRFRKNFGTTKPACTDWSALDIPYSSAPTALDTWGHCDIAGATCTVTALTGATAAEACATPLVCDPIGSSKVCRCRDIRPTQWQISIPAGHWSASCGTVSDCQLAEGTFILDLMPGQSCVWQYLFPGSPGGCQWKSLTLGLGTSVPGNLSMSILLAGGTGGGDASWGILVPYTHTSCGGSTPSLIDCNLPRDIDFCAVRNGIGIGAGTPCLWDGLAIKGAGVCHPPGDGTPLTLEAIVP